MKLDSWEKAYFADIQKQLNIFKKVGNIHHDWHEPDQYGVEARIEGNHLDNAGCDGEYVVKLTLINVPDPITGGLYELEVNLATLLAIATMGEELK